MITRCEYRLSWTLEVTKCWWHLTLTFDLGSCYFKHFCEQENFPVTSKLPVRFCCSFTHMLMSLDCFCNSLWSLFNICHTAVTARSLCFRRTVQFLAAQPQGQYWAGRTPPPYNGPPNMAATNFVDRNLPPSLAGTLSVATCYDTAWIGGTASGWIFIQICARDVVKRGICYQNVCPSVSVRDTRESRLHGSWYRNMLCIVQ